MNRIEQQNRNLYTTIALAFMLATSLFLFIPFDIYVNNHDEFISPLGAVLSWMILPGFFIFLLLTLFAILLKRTFQVQYMGILCALTFLLWLQSDVLIWEYGVLNGDAITWSASDWQGWLDLGLWIGVILACTFLPGNRKVLTQFVAILFVVQMAMMLVNAGSNWKELNSSAGLDNTPIENFYGFSAQQNVVHILLDGFQSDILTDLVSAPGVGEEMRALMPGFVFYKETLGVFPYTRFALPALLSGKLYENNISKDSFVDAAFQGNTILNTAYEQGFEVDLASEEYWAQRYAMSKHTNAFVIPDKIGDESGDLVKRNGEQILDLSLFRAAPHFIKKYIYNNQNWFIQSLNNDPRAAFRYFAHERFMQDLITNMSVTRDAPVYKLLHVMSVHQPMVVNPDCSFAGGAIATTREALTVQSFCTMQYILGIFDKMRQLDIYDDALIIIHADHGSWTSVRGYTGITTGNGGTLSPDVVSLATPLLAIKQPNATYPFTVSEALVSLTDIPDTISDIMNWGQDFGHRSVISVEPDENRERSFYYYTWQRDAWETDYTGPIQEFDIKGKHVNGEWDMGNVFLPPASESDASE